ncbi:MAG: hypothetical protein JO252_19480 [Planctomycetaceae bacterium]|nr:hypothetical protein [Planctomycetaceae bacterium]
MALAVRWGVAAARAGPDRVGSRARRSGAAARAADGVRGRWGSRPLRGASARQRPPPRSFARRRHERGRQPGPIFGEGESDHLQ